MVVEFLPLVTQFLWKETLSVDRNFYFIKICTSTRSNLYRNNYRDCAITGTLIWLQLLNVFLSLDLLQGELDCTFCSLWNVGLSLSTLAIISRLLSGHNIRCRTITKKWTVQISVLSFMTITPAHNV